MCIICGTIRRTNTVRWTTAPTAAKREWFSSPSPSSRPSRPSVAPADTPVVLLSPQGRPFDARLAAEMARHPQVVLICGRYEGVDERVAEHLATDEVSIGDYVLTGGELAAMVVVDAVSRFIPGVVGREESVRRESFRDGRLDYPQYTRPREFRGMKVPAGPLFGGPSEDRGVAPGEGGGENPPAEARTSSPYKTPAVGPLTGPGRTRTKGRQE